MTPVTIETSQPATTNTAPVLDLPDLEFLAVTGKSESKAELLVPPFPSRTSSSTSISSSEVFVDVPLNQSNQAPNNDGSFSSLFSRLKDETSDSDDDDLLFSSESDSAWSTSDDFERSSEIPRDLPAVDNAPPPVHDEDDW